MARPFVEDEIGLWVEQDLEANLDYGLDWSDWIALSAGDRITGSVWMPQSGLVTSGADFADATTSIWVHGTEAGKWYSLRNVVTSLNGRTDARDCLVYIKPSASAGAGMFANRAVALAIFRRDTLAMMSESLLPGVKFADSYLWDKLLAAQADVAGMLSGVPLAPTEVFPGEPTADELAALQGAPYIVEPGYDMAPDFFQVGRWGSLMLRVRPVIAVSDVRFVYPSLGDSATFVVPLEWVRLDRKYGHVHFFPTASPVTAPLSIFTLQALGSGVTVPHMIRVRYRAGIDASSPEFANVRNLVMQAAALQVLQDTYAPTSGSLSADGFSQSSSIDLGKYQEDLESRAYSLREKILGPVWGVL